MLGNLNSEKSYLTQSLFCDEVKNAYFELPIIKKNFSKIREGDYVAITDVGAYGMSLASNYNARPTIAEVMVSGSSHKIIRKRQSLADLVNN